MALDKNPHIKADETRITQQCLQCMTSLVCTMMFAVIMLILVMIWRGTSPACDVHRNSVSASVSLARVDFVSSNHNNDLSSSNFTFNVHVELLADIETEYGNTTLFLRSHDGTDLDGFEISGARLGMDETRRLDVSVRMVSRYRFDGSVLVYSDPVCDGGDGGVVKLRTHVTFSGEGGGPVIKVRPVAEATCELSVDLRSRALIYSDCIPKVTCK